MKTMSIAQALAWADVTEVHEYIIFWNEDDAYDSGNRGGFDDAELAQINDALAKRGMTLATDDIGIYATRH